jgi:putative membrane protein
VADDAADHAVPLDDPRGTSGNRARDHLANERTYLSWLRTALGVIALSVAVGRFGPGEAADDAAVIVLGVLGLAILAIGTWRFYRVSTDLEHDRFRLSRGGPLVVALVVAAAALVLVPMVL